MHTYDGCQCVHMHGYIHAYLVCLAAWLPGSIVDMDILAVCCSTLAGLLQAKARFVLTQLGFGHPV